MNMMRVWNFFFLLFSLIFLVWLINSLDRYNSMSASSKISFRYGDDGDRLVKFPSISICKAPTSAILWKGGEPSHCKNDHQDYHDHEEKEEDDDEDEHEEDWENVQPPHGKSETAFYQSEPHLPQPFFLSWLENCLQNDENVHSISELVKRVTYDPNDEHSLLNYVLISPENVTSFDKPDNKKIFLEKITKHNYHTNYGDCVTIDLESLSENGGKFPISSASGKTSIKLSINMEDYGPETLLKRKRKQQLKHYFFLHDNSANVEELGVNIKAVQFWGGIKDTQEFTIKKTIINSLPTRNELCNAVDYATCIKDTISKSIKNYYNCSIPFLNKNDVTEEEVCSSNVSLYTIREMKIALDLEEYGNCKDLKLCNDIVYELVNPENPTHGGIIVEKDRSDHRIRKAFLKFSFDGLIVQIIEDSYDYDFFSIFSEIGGSIGILIGMSCMTIVEFLIDAKKCFSKLYK